MASNSAFGFHQIHCKNSGQSIEARILSDAHFGLIINADLTYGNRTVNFIAQPNGNPFRYVQNGIAIIPFDSGETAVLSSDEATLVIYDNKGLLVDTLTCPK